MFSAETQRFDRFLVSLGLIAVVLAGLIPWSVYSRLDVLQITRTELAKLTPTAIDVIEQRQDMLRVAQEWLVVASAVLVVLGLVLLVLGAVGLRSAQSVEDERLRSERDKAKHDAALAKKQAETDIGVQTESERAVMDAEREEASPVDSEEGEQNGEPTGPEPTGPQGEAEHEPAPGGVDDVKPPEKAEETGRTSRLADLARTTIVHSKAFENAILAELPNVRLSRGYRVRTHVAIRHQDEDVGPLFLDALYLPAIAADPHVVVSVKTYRLEKYGLRERRDVVEALGTLEQYRQRRGVDARVWLIVALERGVVDPDDLRRRLQAQLGDAGLATVVLAGLEAKLATFRLPHDVTGPLSPFKLARKLNDGE